MSARQIRQCLIVADTLAAGVSAAAPSPIEDGTTRYFNSSADTSVCANDSASIGIDHR